MTESMGRMIGILGVTAVVSWVSVGLLRYYALGRGVLDQPNERSSHGTPTPRGGGAGLVAAAVLGFVLLSGREALGWRVVLALLGILPTALVGWLDDHKSVSVSTRIGAHLVSASMILPLAIGSGASPWIVAILSVGWIIAVLSAINVVNFIDGIDGLIGLQALALGVHFAVLSQSQGRSLGLALAVASAAFLIWNWTPAKIFLGDVGSGSLAVIGVVGGILVWRGGNRPFIVVFLPLVAIFLDASVTILGRWRRGESLTAAHRTHLYQRLANEAGWGHARASALYGVIAALATAIVLATPPALLFIACVAYALAIVLVGWYLNRSARPPEGKGSTPDTRESKQAAQRL